MKSAGSWKPFFLVSVGVLMLVGGGLAAYALFGGGVLRSAYEGKSIAPLNELFHAQGRLDFEFIRKEADELVGGITAVLLAVYSLGCCLWFALRAPHRLRRVAALLVVWWVALELLAAPFLVRVLRLNNYKIIRDVDHRPEVMGPEWNSDALRATRGREAFRAENMNILFLGDSFALGFRVRGNEAFPIRTGDLLRATFREHPIEVANFAWTSSSPWLSYRRLVEIGEAYAPDMVVQCIDMTDFQDEIRWRNMLARKGIYRLYDKIPVALKVWEKCAPGLFERVLSWSVGGQPLERFFAVKDPLETTRHWFAPLVESLDAIATWCAEHDAAFVVVVAPRSYQYSDRECPSNWEAAEYPVLGPYVLEPFRFFDELSERVDYPIYSLLAVFRDTDVFPTCFEDDPHWNRDGHRVAAGAVARLLEPHVRALIERD